jgi:hypothetical protein
MKVSKGKFLEACDYIKEVNSCKLSELDISEFSINKDSTKESWRMWAHNIPGECACGIPTHMCTYHK